MNQKGSMHASSNSNRTGSSLRYAQFPSAEGDVSTPSTPQGYISSSLNPTRNIPSTSYAAGSYSLGSVNGGNIEELSVIKHINNIERALNNLTSQISSFDDDKLNSTTDEIIRYNDIKTAKVAELRKHAELGKEIRSLENQVSTLGDTSKDILKELMVCHRELQVLPRLPSREVTPFTGDLQNERKVQDVLKYAMKLSRFTKVPSSSSSTMVPIHPNNFIWPAEDSLRRGMLAISSLKGDQIINEELGYSEDSDDLEVKPINDSNMDIAEKETSVNEKEDDIKESPEKASEDTSHHAVDQSSNNSEVLNLDLFNPEDDDFSD